MDLRKIKKLIDLLEESNLAEIEIKEGEESVRLARVPRGMTMAAPAPAPVAHAEAPHVVDVTDHFDAKVRALKAHASQTAHQGDGLEEMLRGWNAVNAARAGLPEGRLAEVFAVSRIN